jgi:uncharacterized protein involved in exopolysaccharide biosynthesis
MTNPSAFRFLRRYGPAAALPGLVFGLAAAVVVLVARPLFLSTVTVAPDAPEGGGLGALAGMAGPFAQLGLSLFGEGGRSLAFYSYLAQSDNVAAAVVDRPLPDSLAPHASSLAHLWFDDTADTLLRTDRAVRRFRARTTIHADERTGIIRVQFLGESPGLAQWVTAAVYDELNRYNVEVRGSRARERRRFLDERVDVSADSLLAAEVALRDFYEQNRQWEEDPRLVFRERQLNRGVDSHLEILNSLRRELELAKLDEVRDTPVLNVVQPPSLPVRKAWPPRTRLTVLWAMLGAVVGIALEFGRPWTGALFRRLVG